MMNELFLFYGMKEQLNRSFSHSLRSYMIWEEINHVHAKVGVVMIILATLNSYLSSHRLEYYVCQTHQCAQLEHLLP